MNDQLTNVDGFNCFRWFFRFINTQESKLRSSDIVLEFDLLGLERYEKHALILLFTVCGLSY